MSDLTEYVALEVNGEEITVYDVLLPAKAHGNLEFVQEAIDGAIIRQMAERQAIEVSDEELQQAADDFRLARELYSPEALTTWLTARRLTFEDWEAVIESSLLRQKLCEAVTAGKIEQHFAENKLSFDEAEISRLVVADEDIARELLAQIAEEGADFHLLARTYSIDAATRPAGGYAGKVKRTDMEAVMEPAVFGAQPGKVTGPFKLDDGWHLIKIELLHPAELDNTVRETIKEQVFADWLEERRQRSEIKLPLLNVVAPKDDTLEDLRVPEE
ncbi:MAG TPA: peptidylprolyl isomerase [Pyrinomonadaceae bacterium]|nr:peptidylprolyl isomerase [Pyrinomonadaceae bacterium]